MSDGLAARVVSGGSVLLVRQVGGAAVAFGGMLVLARLLGPAESGLYFTAFGIVFFVQNIAKLGLDVFLVRAPGEVGRAALDQVFTLMLGFGIVAAAGLAAASGAIAGWMHLPRLAGLLAAMAASVLVMHLYRVPLSVLERGLAFRQVGLAELAAQALFFAVAIAAALAGWGAYAPVAGWWAQQAALLAACFGFSGYRPRLAWDRAVAGDALAYGALQTGSILILSLRTLMVPVFLGGTQGPAAVGVVTLAVRLLENLSTCRAVITRMSIPLLAQLAADRQRLLRVFSMGIEVQTIVVALPVTAASLIAAWLVPFLFGEEWRAAATMVTLLSPPMIAQGVFGMHSYLLMSLRRPVALIVSQAAATGLAWAAALFFIPRLGAVGYACAEIAAIAAWIVPCWFIDHAFGRVRYAPAILWALAASVTALAPVHRLGAGARGAGGAAPAVDLAARRCAGAVRQGPDRRLRKGRGRVSRRCRCVARTRRRGAGRRARWRGRCASAGRRWPDPAGRRAGARRRS